MGDAADGLAWCFEEGGPEEPWVDQYRVKEETHE